MDSTPASASCVVVCVVAGYPDGISDDDLSCVVNDMVDVIDIV